MAVTATDPAVAGTQAAAYAALNASGAAAKKDDGSDRFLKLLVTQMQNQDPLNPMDNAQVTSQLAQINTVTGIEKVNQSVGALSTQMLQSRALQGASLVGHHVLMEGKTLEVESGKASAGYELESPADSVQLEVLAPSGRVVDTVQLGAQAAGRNAFDWTAPAGASTDGLTFRITALSGATKLAVTPLVTDRVDAVSMQGDALTLELGSGGSIAYDKVKAIS